MKAIVSEKGQVTIPKPCRDRLGLRPGTELDFEAQNGRLIAVKRQGQDVFRKWRGRGKLPGHLGVDAYLAKVRG
ncbi:MAG: AbrB/MazE/SpoVT family DNA-binding domain-containing protein [Verrucomicrobia bacterium]|nr:AbrB/MazE/SpoVT family DNA-binding domain-containing protein [Verrucomicrobiota bacterium]